MREFIEELKYNKKINEEKGLENRVDVDYVIERLENIYPYEEFIKDEIDWITEAMYNDDLYDEETKEKIGNLSNEDIQDIVDVIVEDDYISETLNSTITDVIREKIGFEWE
jgi:hypothetical protein